MHWSEDLRVMAAPQRTYEEAAAHASNGAWVAVRRPALVALVLGFAAAYSATGHVTAKLLVSEFVCWSFVPLMQIATAALVMRSAAARSFPVSTRLDLWFLGHAPWSLWMIAVSLTFANSSMSLHADWPIIASALVPIAWTSAIAAAFCRVILQDPSPAAIARTAIHQVVTWTIALLYVNVAVALWPRVAAWAGF